MIDDTSAASNQQYAIISQNAIRMSSANTSRPVSLSQLAPTKQSRKQASFHHVDAHQLGFRKKEQYSFCRHCISYMI